MGVAPKAWTEQEDERICDLYALGMSWDKIAETFSVSRSSVMARGHRLGCTTRVRRSLTPRVRKQPPPPPEPVEIVPQGPRSFHVLPPGHERSWQPIIAGTLLEGVRYPEKDE